MERDGESELNAVKDFDAHLGVLIPSDSDRMGCIGRSNLMSGDTLQKHTASECDSLMTSRPSIAQLKGGDSDAWAWFFKEFSGQIAGYARRMGVSDPDDVTGTVLETVARSVGSFSGSHSQFRSWVFSIAHARIVDDHRRRDRRPETEFTERHDRTQAGADSFATSGDPGLETAMNQLTDEQRSLLHLRFVLELSMKEIAGVTDKSEVATRVALHRCSKRLRELLSNEVAESTVES
jgi:RNA polymerase sigma factor (sigma-70 family)